MALTAEVFYLPGRPGQRKLISELSEAELSYREIAR